VTAISEATTLRKHVELSRTAVDELTAKMVQQKGAVQTQRLEVVQLTNELNTVRTAHDDLLAYVTELRVDFEVCQVEREEAMHQADLLEVRACPYVSGLGG
jgi:chromosome segregation ATPase